MNPKVENYTNEFLTDILVASASLSSDGFFKLSTLFENYQGHFDVIDGNIYQKLNPEDQQIFVLWFLKRWGNIQLVPTDKLEAYDKIAARAKEPQFTESSLGGKNYRKVNFLDQGYDFDLIQYSWVLGIHDIYYNQYEHRSVKIEPGDIIIDAGAFIGDTAVLFDHKAKGNCEIHCFELLDENLKLLNKNAELNCISRSRLHVNQLALTDKSGEFVEIEESVLQGATKIGESTDAHGKRSIATITIDDYVSNNNISQVDFIKMDIEGAELNALKGATKTIREKKPKLAVCLYHLPEDPVLIPKLINSICPEYRFFFKWVHLRSGWEAVLLADARETTAAEGQVTNSNIDKSKELNITLIKLLEHYSEKYKQADRLWKARLSKERLMSKIKRIVIKARSIVR